MASLRGTRRSTGSTASSVSMNSLRRTGDINVRPRTKPLVGTSALNRKRSQGKDLHPKSRAPNSRRKKRTREEVEKFKQSMRGAKVATGKSSELFSEGTKALGSVPAESIRSIRSVNSKGSSDSSLPDTHVKVIRKTRSRRRNKADLQSFKAAVANSTPNLVLKSNKTRRREVNILEPLQTTEQESTNSVSDDLPPTPYTINKSPSKGKLMASGRTRTKGNTLGRTSPAASFDPETLRKRLTPKLTLPEFKREHKSNSRLARFMGKFRKKSIGSPNARFTNPSLQEQYERKQEEDKVDDMTKRKEAFIRYRRRAKNNKRRANSRPSTAASTLSSINRPTDVSVSGEVSIVDLTFETPSVTSSTVHSSTITKEQELELKSDITEIRKAYKKTLKTQTEPSVSSEEASVLATPPSPSPKSTFRLDASMERSDDRGKVFKLNEEKKKKKSKTKKKKSLIQTFRNKMNRTLRPVLEEDL